MVIKTIVNCIVIAFMLPSLVLGIACIIIGGNKNPDLYKQALVFKFVPLLDQLSFFLNKPLGIVLLVSAIAHLAVLSAFIWKSRILP